MSTKHSTRIPLFFAFWYLGIVPAFCYGILLCFADQVANDYHLNIDSAYYFFLAILLIPLLYFPFVVMIIWRSANNYTGNKIVASLAKGFSLITLIAFLISILYLLYIPPEPSTKYVNNRSKFTDTLGKTMRFQTKSIILDTAAMSQKKIDAIITRDHNDIVSSLCSSKSTLDLLQHHDVIYEYYDINEKYIYGFKVTKQDCN